MNKQFQRLKEEEPRRQTLPASGGRVGFFRASYVMGWLWLVVLTGPLTMQAQFSYSIDNGKVRITGYTGFETVVTIPEIIDGLPVASIGYEAFFGRVDLTMVTIPNNVINIEGRAFRNCRSLTSITIPSSVTNVGEQAFTGCTELAGITVDADNPAFSSVDGVLFDKSRNLLIQFPNGTVESYSIPSSVTSIGDYAFYGCTRLTNVAIPTSVTSIGNAVFVDCKKLTSATIPGSVTNLGEAVFLGCGNLTSVTIPGSVNSIGNEAFSYCYSLMSLTIGSGVTSIGYSAFDFCSSLTNVVIPRSVTSIGGYAFSYCYSLDRVYFLGNAPSFGPLVFGDNTPATVYYLPGTIGWGLTYGDRPTVIWEPLVQVDGTNSGVRTNQFGFSIKWASGRTVVVEASTDLAEFFWTPVGTSTLMNGSSYFSDPQWTNSRARFYRLRAE